MSLTGVATVQGIPREINDNDRMEDIQENETTRLKFWFIMVGLRAKILLTTVSGDYICWKEGCSDPDGGGFGKMKGSRKGNALTPTWTVHMGWNQMQKHTWNPLGMRISLLLENDKCQMISSWANQIIFMVWEERDGWYIGRWNF